MSSMEFHVVVTDRNPHVRELLSRELLRDGFRVSQARDADQLREILGRGEAVHVVILDPELRGVRVSDLSAAGGLRVVVFAQRDAELAPELSGAACVAARVDKQGDLDGLRGAVRAAVAGEGEDVR